jgi:two-component system, NarL family, sensor kinase
MINTLLKKNVIRFFLFSFFFFLLSSLSTKASLNTDSLINTLKCERKDSMRLEILGDLAYEFVFIDSAKAAFYNKQMLEETLKTSNKFAIARAYYSAALYYSELSNFDEALAYYNKSIALLNTFSFPKAELTKVRVMLNKARLYQNNGDFEKALSIYIESERLLIKHKNYNGLVQLYANVSTIYYKLFQPQRGKSYALKLKDLFDKVSEPKFKAASYMTYASALMTDSQYREAELYLLKAEAIAEKSGVLDILSRCYYNHGYLLYVQKKYKQELFYNQRLYHLAKQSGLKKDICDALYALGENYTRLHKYELAKQSLDSAWVLALEIKDKVQQRDIIEAKTELAARSNQFELAYGLGQQSYDLTIGLLSEENQKHLNALDAKYQAQQRETKIKDLEKENELQKRRGQLIVAMVIILVLVVIVLTSIIIIYRNRHKISARDAIIQKERIKQLERERKLVATQSVLDGEEAERRRLARDLHDGLGGLLSGIKFTLNNMKGNQVITEEGVQNFSNALNLLDQSIVELRRVAHSMMPESLLKFGLKDSLDDFCSSISKSQACKIAYSFYGPGEGLPQNIEIAMYRIAQELINNTIKHAGASEIEVQIVRDDERICLSVNDNGVGFDVTLLNANKGIGLRGIKARAESVGGRCDINSTVGSGTEILVEIPLTQAE